MKSGKAHACLIGGGNPANSGGMRRLFDMDDRARLRERFFGATHTVLARL